MNCIDWSSKRSKQLINVPKLQNWSNYNELHRFYVKTIQKRKTTKAIKLRSICIHFTSKRSKMLSYVAKHSKQRKTINLIKLQWIASIWCQNDQNNAKLQPRSNYDKFASIWRQNYQNVQVLHKTIKTTQNYKTDQITMNCIDWSSKRSKKLSNVPKLQKWSNYNELIRQNDQKRQTTNAIKLRSICIDLTSKRSKMLSYVAKHSKQRKTTKVIKL